MKKGKWFHKMSEQEKKQPTADEVNEKEAEASEQAADQAAQETENPELDALKEENQQLKDKLLRQMAEFENFKKRTSREKEELYNFAKADCVEQILGVIDNFERALETECGDENFKKGVEMIFTQFTATLQKLGVEEIKALGETFDPNFHNAVNQIQDDNFGDNEVCQVFQKGYKIGGKVIRHAMVVVANP